MTDLPIPASWRPSTERSSSPLSRTWCLYTRCPVDDADLTEFQKVLIRDGVATKLLRANRASLGFLSEELDARLDEDVNQ